MSILLCSGEPGRERCGHGLRRPGLVLALARRGEVVRVVSDADSVADALRDVGERLDIGPEPARAGLDLQLVGMSRERTASIVDERDLWRAHVDSLDN